MFVFEVNFFFSGLARKYRKRVIAVFRGVTLINLGIFSAVCIYKSRRYNRDVIGRVHYVKCLTSLLFYDHSFISGIFKTDHVCFSFLFVIIISIGDGNRINKQNYYIHF